MCCGDVPVMSAVCTEWSALESVLCKAVCCTVLSIPMWAECNSTSPPNSITFIRSRGISRSIVCCHDTVYGVLGIQRMDRISMSSANHPKKSGPVYGGDRYIQYLYSNPVWLSHGVHHRNIPQRLQNDSSARLAVLLYGK